MYDKFLSTQWLYDRCLEGSYSGFYGVFFLSIFMSFFSVIFFSKIEQIIHNPNNERSLLVRIVKTFTSPIIVLFIALTLLFIPLSGIVSSPVAILIFIINTIFFATLMSIVILGFISKKTKKKTPFAFKVFTASFFSLPFSFFLFIFVGFFVLNCTDHMFWKAVRPAHQIHGQLKNLVTENKPLPETKEELVQLNPTLYSEIESNAKTEYIYSEDTKTFTWFIRPSKYFTVIFDSENDFRIYKLSMLEHFFGAVSFPPLYKGPWDQLPN